MPIEIKNLTHIYDQGSPYQTAALDEVSLQINDGEILGLIGHTGSGKSTLIQHMNGLLKATSGSILIDGVDITARGVRLDSIRKKVGLVFQYPEYQLFEETIAKDVAFGPAQQGLSGQELTDRVMEAMSIVGLDYGSFKDRSPFELSGGQRRRAAIAGILAMEPKYLILDEPTAGLDPKGREDVLGQILSLHQSKGIAVILVSHSMEDIAKLVDRIVVMHQGKIALSGPPAEVFKHAEELKAIGLGVPQVTEMADALKVRGFDLGEGVYTVEEARSRILKVLKEGSPC